MMEQISREQYLKALELIDKYHRQDITSKPVLKKSMFNLKRGDFVQCINVHSQSKNNLTKLKVYEVLDSQTDDSNRKWFEIIDDRGKRRCFFCKNSQFHAFDEWFKV